MKCFLSFLLSALLLASCGNSRGSFTLKGSFRHLQEGEFYVYSTDPSWSGFDTIHIEDGEFQFTHELVDTTILTVQYPNFMQMQVIAVPGGTVKIKGDANNLLTAKISGNEDNDLLTKFRHSIVKKSPVEVRALAEKFIKAHPASFASLVLLEKYYITDEHFDAGKINELLMLLYRATPGRTAVKSLQTRFEPFRCTQHGQPLPSFSAMTLKEEKINNSTFKDKPLLIWFWSTWGQEQSQPIIRERTDLRPYIGKLGILNICLDADTTGCKRVVKQDSVPGHVVCDRLSWNSPLILAFGVRSLPASILVDEAGKVICRDADEETILRQLQTKFRH